MLARAVLTILYLWHKQQVYILNKGGLFNIISLKISIKYQNKIMIRIKWLWTRINWIS